MRAEGASCRIINFSVSDWCYRAGLGANNYWGRVNNWDGYLEKYIEKHKITDIVYYSDQRPYHRIARAIAIEKGLNCFAYEYGYFRPNWITLERGGMGVFSHFPNDPNMIRELADKIEYRWPDEISRHRFLLEAVNETFYNLAPVFMPYLFPFYDRDRYYHPLIEFPCYIPRLLRSKSNQKIAGELINKVTTQGDDYFVVPLQLQSDYQLRRASKYSHMREMILEVISSFSSHAPEGTRLIFKLHPLDNNLVNWSKFIGETATKFNCNELVEIIDGGDLKKLLKSAKGNVLINSTTAITALELGVPTKVLGIAIFDVEGMTDQNPLHDFWKAPFKPDADLVVSFLKLLAASVQVRGNFYTQEGREYASAIFVERLLANDVNSFGAFVDPPPRLAEAKSMGVPITYENLTSR